MNTEILRHMAQVNETTYLDGLEKLVQKYYHIDEEGNGAQFRQDRTKTGTVSHFAVHQTFVCHHGLIPLVSTKKVFVKSMMAELLWFLEGSTNAFRLNELGSKIWDEWRPEVSEQDLKRLTDIAHANHRRETTDLLLSKDIICVAPVEYREKNIPEGWEMFSIVRGPKVGHRHPDYNAVEYRHPDYNAVEYRHPDYNAIVVKRLLEKGFIAAEDLGEVGDIGPAYGKQWMSWDDYVFSRRASHEDGEENVVRSQRESMKEKGYTPLCYQKSWEHPQVDDTYHRSINQIENLIQGLIDNPFSRRHVVWAWNPGDAGKVELPPCHMGFVCYAEENPGHPHTLHMHMTQRSQDVFLGAPFNIASYGALLQLLCQLTGYKPGTLSVLAVDQHLYLNHIEQAVEQVNRKPLEHNAPQIVWDVERGSGAEGLRAMLKKVKEDNAHPYIIEGYAHMSPIKAPVAVRAKD